ncbi:hypothetical protein Tsubulata_044111 [Turnera subulata]|uniref:Wall-associated receptor kinase galacturonan-binding domain-containing protein n=1 Tax=Turnera subulata TaxID=218843 RepID=A0A9Q0G7T1_9ROSI|nr:hypothetical protein Tsubulata_044111 [Turnera subulata]
MQVLELGFSMERDVSIMFMLVVALLSSWCAIAMRTCGNCGRYPVPYPLSTGPSCGDQLYKLRCTAGTLWFDALNGSSYMITSITPLTRRIIIRPAGLAAKTCISSDLRSQGIQLNDKLPFSIATSNTVLLLNCKDAMLHLKPPLDCAPTSLCHNYIRDVAAPCMSQPICCTFKISGPQNNHMITVHDGGCQAYQSFVNLNLKAVSLKKWPEPGVEIEWALPKEPIYPKCRPGKPCKKPKKKTAVFAGAAIAGVAVLVTVVVGIIFYKQHQRIRKAQKNLVRERKEMLNSKCSGKSARIFTGKEIAKATNNFCKDNLIGSGGVLGEDRLMDDIDPVLKEGASKLELETMKALGSLAEACLDEKRQNRPSMKEVADEIEYIISITTSGKVSKC